MANKSRHLLNHFAIVYVSLTSLLIVEACNLTGKTKKNDFHIRKETIEGIIEKHADDSVALTNYLQLAVNTHDKYTQMVVFRQMGNLYRDKNFIDKAIENHQNYLKIALSTHDTLNVIKAANALAKDIESTTNCAESAMFYTKAFNIATKNIPNYKNIYKEETTSLRGLSNLFFKCNEPNKSIPLLKKALNLDSINKDLTLQAIDQEALGDIYTYNQNFDSANYFYLKSLETCRQNHNQGGIYTCYQKLGQMMIKKGDFNNAKKDLFLAFNGFSKISNKRNSAVTLILLGELATKTKEYAIAEKHLYKGLMLAKQNKYNDLQISAYRILSNLHHEQGQFVKAYEELALNQSIEKQTNHLKPSINLYQKKQFNIDFAALDEFSTKKTKRIQHILMISFFAIICFFLVINLIIKKFRWNKRKKIKNLFPNDYASSFYMNLSNELNTSSIIIHKITDSLKNNVHKNDQVHAQMNMEIISKETENLEFHSDQILSMLSLTQETNHVQKIYYDIISFISIFVESLVENNTCYQNVEFRFLPPGYDVWMDFSPEYMRIILQNIVHDAMERCSINNRIEIRAAKNETGKLCFIYISDNGKSNTYQNDSNSAIHKYEKQQNRADANNSNMKLLLARQLIASQGGNLHIECHSKENTTIKLSLPIAHHAQISKTNELEIKDYFQRPLFENMQKHLLFIVVNNPQNIKRLISPLKHNFDLIIVDDENELFKLVVEKKPQCIIFEINASCIENNSILLGKIKESDQTSSIPVILLTFETTFSDHFHLLKNKADACLAQPFANEELISLIKKLIYLKTQVTIYKDFFPVNEDVEQIENSEKKYDPQFIEQITNIIYRESGKNEDLIPFLASEMCLSQCQLNRRIKAATELTTSNFILRVRLNKAKKLLTKSQKPIGEIALECGFNDFSYFSRSFKLEFRMTPSAFQRLPHYLT